MKGLSTRESMSFLEGLIKKKINSFHVIDREVLSSFIKRFSIFLIPMVMLGWKCWLTHLLIVIEALLPIFIIIFNRREHLYGLKRILAKIILLKDDDTFDDPDKKFNSKDPEIFLVNCLRDDVWIFIPHGLLCPGDLIYLEDHQLNKIIPLKIVKMKEEKYYRVLSPILLENQLENCPFKIKLEFNFSGLIHLFWVWKNPSSIGRMLIIITSLWEVIMIAWCNSRILTLSTNLNSSPTPYVEIEGADEFDEDEPAPLKNIKLPFMEIFKKSFFGLLGGDGGIFWAYDLSKSLGSEISVIAFLDREGTICPCYPKPLEVIFPNPLLGDDEHDDLAFGEFIHAPLSHGNRPQIKTNYSNPLLGDSHIKALGLAIMMSSNHVDGTNIHEPHLRMNRISLQNIDSIMRSCPCIVGRELGFSSIPSDRYIPLKDYWLKRMVNPIQKDSSQKEEFMGLFTRTFTDLHDSSKHLISYGDVTTSISLSNWIWSFSGDSTKSIKPLNPSLKERLLRMAMNFENSDLQCLSITYRPILCPLDEMIPYFAEIETIPSSIKDTLYSNHIFLGCLISTLTPKDDMQAFIDDLENAGIRFVYFSPFNETITKAFGDRLGLQTDWNCCINFSNTSLPNCSKLPRNVEEIRNHLKMVDDVPMNVSLFSSSHPSDVTEMMKIYSEEGKGVLGIGSSMNPANIFSFPLTNLPLVMVPQKGDDSLSNLQSDIGSFGCPIKLFFETSPYTLTEIVREGRCLWRRREAFLSHIKLCSPFFIGSDFSLLMFINFSLSSFVIFCFVKAFKVDVMKRMPSSTVLNDDDDTLIKKIKLLIDVLRNILIFFLLYNAYIPKSSLGFHLIIGFFGLFRGDVVPFLFYWFPFSIFFILKDGFLLEDISSTIIVIIVPVSIFLFITMRIEDRIYINVERRSKLQFNTKLGMHSPI